jgi:hypothetical protein
MIRISLQSLEAVSRRITVVRRSFVKPGDAVPINYDKGRYSRVVE